MMSVDGVGASGEDVPFAFVGDVSRGAWLAERLDERATNAFRPREVDALAATVPSGYPALVRVLHPFTRDRLAEGTFAELNVRIERGEHQAEYEFVEGGEATWRATAAADGTLEDVVKLGQTHGRLEFSDAELAACDLRDGVLRNEVLGVDFGESPEEEAADGWRYVEPEEGRTPTALLSKMARVLARHTATPQQGIAAVWEGFGGLVTSQGVSWFTFVPEAPSWVPGPVRPAWRHAQQRRHEFEMRQKVFGREAALRHLMLPEGPQPPGSGILPKEAAAGPRLQLPHRNYVCFEAGIEAFADEGWIRRAPWAGNFSAPEADAPDPRDVQTPNLLWPEDPAWVLITEIDFDSTLIACSEECADALLSTEGLESLRISRDTRL